jgi:transglutaminase-like putative cysteine protease
MKNAKPVILLISVLLFSSCWLSVKADDIDIYHAQSYDLSYPMGVTANYTYLITPRSPVSSVSIYLLHSFPYMEVIETGILTEPHHDYDVKEEKDELGNVVSKITFHSVKTGFQFALKVIQHVTLYSVVFQIDPAKVGEYNLSSALYQTYTAPSTFIESDHPEIVSKAREIVGNETNPYLKARKIYDFIVHHVTRDWPIAQYDESHEGALYALRTGKGACRHFAALFTALARASGVPCSMIWGSWGIGNVAKHDWVHFYLPNCGWIPVEATHGDSMTDVWKWFAAIPDSEHIPVLSVNYGYRIATGRSCEVNQDVPCDEAPYLTLGEGKLDTTQTVLSTSSTGYSTYGTQQSGTEQKLSSTCSLYSPSSNPLTTSGNVVLMIGLVGVIAVIAALAFRSKRKMPRKA